MSQIVPNSPFRRLPTRFVPLLAVCVLSSFLVRTALTAEKYALLVGVTTYEHAGMNGSPLKFPEADAQAVHELLKGSGYEVDLLLGKAATRKAVQSALERAGREGTQNGIVLIGLFGHGVQYGDQAFFGAFDTKIRTVKDSQGNVLRDGNRPKMEPDPATMVSMRDVLDALNTCGAGSRVLLADCCREDPSRARGRAFGTTLTTKDLPPGTLALFACSANQQAFEHDDWGHGAFTLAFLENVTKLANNNGRVLSGALSDQVALDVQDLVRDKTSGREQQTVYTLVSGLVDLRIASNVLAPNPTLARPEPSTTPPAQEPVEPPAERPRVTSRLEGDETSDNGLGLKLCWIPPGAFTMGSPPSEQGRYHNEQRAIVVISQGFWLGKYEVTQSEWRRVMESAPWQGKDFVKEGDRYPATCVSWEDAKAFCAKLTAQERQAGRLKASEEYRLPTEAEWEYACRSETTSPYSFNGDAGDLGDYAWFGGNVLGSGKEHAREVGQKQSNTWGVHDMHGNVWEWCEDIHVWRVPGGADPLVSQGQSSQVSRVYRGGAWNRSPKYCRSAVRGGISPDSQRTSVGFRVLRSSVE